MGVSQWLLAVIGGFNLIDSCASVYLRLNWLTQQQSDRLPGLAAKRRRY